MKRAHHARTKDRPEGGLLFDMIREVEAWHREHLRIRRDAIVRAIFAARAREPWAIAARLALADDAQKTT